MIENEALIRLASFAGLLALFLGVQWLWPRRGGCYTVKRFSVNLGLLVTSAVCAKLILPMSTVAVAFWASTQGWGLFNLVDLPLWLEVILCIVILDFSIYVQHVAMHNIPVLWRLHRLHHNDTSFDVSTSVRFHPVEIILSLLYKMALIAVLGVPVFAVILFEIILNGMAMFTHTNWALPAKIDRMVRVLFITPDTHRVHHSWHEEETNSNYGFNINLWDRIFNTYRSQPREGHEQMTIGLEYFRNDTEQTYRASLTQPFRNTDQ